MDTARLAGSMWDLVWTGAVLAWIYVRSGNLLVAAAVHAITNGPMPLLTAPADDRLANQLRWVVLAGAALCFVSTPRVLRLRRHEE